jgi:hypothetical protein
VVWVPLEVPLLGAVSAPSEASLLRVVWVP